MDWQRFKNYNVAVKPLNISVDFSRISFDGAFFDAMKPKMEKAFADMKALEGGAIANIDENRMVGH